MSDIVEIFGWKGKDKIQIKESTDLYCITAHHQEKKEGNIKTLKHYIPKRNVNNFMNILSQVDAKVDGYKYRDIVPEVIKFYKLDINIEGFNGGVNRARYYFPYYYYPVKILESKGIIEYSGRGTIKMVY